MHTLIRPSFTAFRPPAEAYFFPGSTSFRQPMALSVRG